MKLLSLRSNFSSSSSVFRLLPLSLARNQVNLFARLRFIWAFFLSNLETQVQCSYFFLSSSSSSSFVFCFLLFFALHPSLTHSLKSNCIGSPFDFYVCVFSLQSTESLTCFISLSVLKCENFAHALRNLNRNIKICWNKNEQINSPFLTNKWKMKKKTRADSITNV